MTTQEIIESINIGFCQPKFYKRSVWNKAKKVMEFLCDNTNGEVTRCNFGPGMGKYTSTLDVPSKTLEWALAYKKSLTPLTVGDTLPLLRRVAEELNTKVNTVEVLEQFYKQYPNLK